MSQFYQHVINILVVIVCFIVFSLFFNHTCFMFRCRVRLVAFTQVFTARCTLVQSAVLRSHVVCLSVRPSVRPSVCDVGEL